MATKIILRIFFLSFFCSSAFAQLISLPNPILFVAQIPIPQDSSTVTSVFSNHLPDVAFAGRGSDLYIQYPDGTLKNLTESAGYGMKGFQGANSITVRQPSVHWSGKKALFSMAIGAPEQQGQYQKYYWQIYEITGLGQSENPVITKIANQPSNFNNVSPIYGTDERIIFTSDRPRDGLLHLYPMLDERFSFNSTSGLWSLDPLSGDLIQLNVSPSGAFNPFIDSYGRVVFTRWDHLQRDQNADKDELGLNVKYGTFNYSDESANASRTTSREEVFPEPEPIRRDQLKGTNLNGLTFNQFFPWQINEDGTGEETLNHAGRHDLLPAFTASVNDDSNVRNFSYENSGRLNKSTLLQNLIQVVEDPSVRGLYYGVNFLGFDQHSSAQIVSLTADPGLDPSGMLFTYITHKSTVKAPTDGAPADPKNSGHYRNPLPLTDGRLLVAHTSEVYNDRNLGSRSHPLSRYAFRIKTMRKDDSSWVADSLMTTGISKTISYWNPDTLVSFSGLLWELDPVEVRVRQKPSARKSLLPDLEKQVFQEENVDEETFRNDLKKNDLALIVSRNITHRDNADHQQPYFLKVHNSATQSANSSGKIYDATHLMLFQADQIRGLTMGNSLPVAGRRILAQYLHDKAALQNPVTIGEKGHTVKIADDGSFAAFVPTRRAITWAVGDSNFIPVVRERYWITAQAGEIRVCASCHGTNDDAFTPLDPAPKNKPEALRTLLRYWKSSHAPLSAELIAPPNDTKDVSLTVPFSWHNIANAKTYQLTISTVQDFSQILFTSAQLSDTFFFYSADQKNTIYYWRVQSFDDGGSSAYSGVWRFTTSNRSAVAAVAGQNTPLLSNHPNPFSSTTSINFSLPKSEAIKLKVFTILGEEVAVLANGYYGRGDHSIPWDASHLPSGTYYYKLQIGEGILTKAIRIIR